ncbi:hypothetical protein BD779DRAFT_1796826 [Infundibulicybe gibba]|nr:hypothetical protein BD779DRAFT_1796826 [Infundibulicybe gibba]
MPAQKKRRTDLHPDVLDEEHVAHAVSDIISEIDLEIGLRQRMVESLESRIAWALAIQNSEPRDGSESHDYRDLALDTLATIDAPCDILFGRTLLPRSKYNTLPRNPKTSFLYICSAGRHLLGDEGNHANQIYLLKCPVCSRTTFTSLQGLLNHARISHKLEWGTHDECVRACAVVDPDLSLEDGIEVGLGPAGILPGLQSIFRMAVGEPLEMEQKKGPKQELGDVTPGRADDASSHLVRTLGLHKDTPALAHFLGKQSVRRNIRVWDEGDVDTHGFTESLLRGEQEQGGQSFLVKPKQLWRMVYSQRNGSKSLAEIPIGEPSNIGIGSDTEVGHTTAQPESISANDQQQHQSPASARNEIAVPTETRFHFVSRLVVADRSLWLPPDRRLDPHKDHTHKWMISIDSPSYAQHITTVLARLAVSTGPDARVLFATEPPFVVIGTANQPFLAKIELTFNGSQKSNAPSKTHAEGHKVFLEHWLDLLKAPYVALGDEQIVDVELDKGISLMPMRTNYLPISSRALWDGDDDTTNTHRHQRPPQSRKIPVRSLLPSFPITSKDAKNRQSTPLAYKLVATPTQFKSLITGRRKAIESNGVSGLEPEAYAKPIIELSRTPGRISILSTADVFSWLADSDYSLVSGTRNRPEPLQNPIGATDPSAPEHSAELFLSVKQEHSDPEIAGADNISTLPAQAPMCSKCPITPPTLQITKIPMIDTYAAMRPEPPLLGNTIQSREIKSRYFHTGI